MNDMHVNTKKFLLYFLYVRSKSHQMSFPSVHMYVWMYVGGLLCVGKILKIPTLTFPRAEGR
jgi:hypothetical protein